MKSTTLVRNSVQLDNITLRNGRFSDISLSKDTSLISIETVKGLQIQNNILSRVKSQDQGDDTSTILTVKTFDLNSTSAFSVEEFTVKPFV